MPASIILTSSSGNFNPDYLTSANVNTIVRWSTGTGDGADDPAKFGANRYDVLNIANRVNVYALALNNGQTVEIDVDYGAGQNAADNTGTIGAESVDLQLTVLDIFGNVVAENKDRGSTDAGSPLTEDPYLSFTAGSPTDFASMIYYVVVHHQNNNYVEDFTFDQGGTGTGNYDIGFQISNLPVMENLGPGDTIFGMGTSSPQRVNLDAGDDIYGAGAGHDTVAAGTGSDVVYGQSGNDILIAEDGDTTFYGGSDDDLLLGHDDNDFLYGGEDEDILIGGTADDFLYGGNLSDILIGGAGNDHLYGQEASDTIYGSFGNDLIDGGDGTDTYDLSRMDSTNRAFVDLNGGDVRLFYNGNGNGQLLYIQEIHSIERLKANDTGAEFYGSLFNDSLTGGAGSDR
ncbi:MAG: calcium-binding protein, partial [Roseovarius sp.]|nr:calcium-binding protein [Roseovarius sp.]